jgi:hypothetical protein
MNANASMNRPEGESDVAAMERRAITAAVGVMPICPSCHKNKVTHAEGKADGSFTLRCAGCIGKPERFRSEAVRRSLSEARARLRAPGADLAAYARSLTA